MGQSGRLQRKILRRLQGLPKYRELSILCISTGIAISYGSRELGLFAVFPTAFSDFDDFARPVQGQSLIQDHHQGLWTSALSGAVDRQPLWVKGLPAKVDQVLLVIR
jgi:hypothetical protein